MLSRFSINNSKKGIVPALCVGLALGMTACSDDDDDTVIVNNITNAFQQGNVVTSQNGANNAGQVSFESVDNVNGTAVSVTKTLNVGGNEGIEFGATQELIQNSDLNGATEIRLFNSADSRSSGDSFNSQLDAIVFPAVNGRMKGGTFVASRNIWLAAVFNGRTSAGSIAGISLDSRGTATAPITPAFTTATFSATNVSGANGITATSPWDLVYDPAADRLFVAMTDGSVAVYDSFFANGPNGATADRFFQFGATNAHGIVYNALTDTLTVSDVGAVTVGPNSDGQIFVITSASTRTGTITPSVTISGAATLLGNPVDLAMNNGVLVIAEKTGDLLISEGVIANLTSGNLPPVASTVSIKPESIAVLDTTISNVITPADVRNPAAFNSLLVARNPGGTADANENTIIALNPTTLASQNMTFNMSGIGNRSIENVILTNSGTGLVTFGNDSGTVTNTVGIGGIARVSMLMRPNRFSSPTAFTTTLDDASLTGANTGLVNPKGIDITDRRGRTNVMIVAEFDNVTTTPAIVVFGLLAANNVAPIARVTNLGLAGRRPWDLDYHPNTDRLFVACTDGTLLRYDNFLQNAGSNAGPTAAASLTHTGGTAAVNLHGIVFNAARNELYISDVGAAGDSTDGRLYVVLNATGFVTGTRAVDASVTDPTRLGNPVDLSFDGANLYVAEKAANGGAVYCYNNFALLRGDLTNVTPNVTANVSAPESVTLSTNSTSNPE